MLFVNEKLLRFALVIAGVATLLGFAWKFYDFVKHREEITQRLDLNGLQAGFGDTDSVLLGPHLLSYAEYKVLQDLNITGYVAPPPVVEGPTTTLPKAIFAVEDVEVPLIQSPNAAWIQGRTEQASGDKLIGDFRVVGETFELSTKAGLKLRLKSVQPGWVEIEVVECGEVVKVYSLTFEVDSSHVFLGDGENGQNLGGEGAVFVSPSTTRETEPYSYAVGKDDVAMLESMSQEQILSSLPHKIHRHPMSNEVDGIRIRSVPENSIFERLGLRAEDIILDVNGQPATDRDQLFEAMQKLDTDILKVRIERLGGVRTLTFRLPK